MNKSIWLYNRKINVDKSLDSDKDVDVLIIGGGITGMQTAYYLKDKNMSVCLVDASFCGSGVTSYSTGKLTYFQDKYLNIFNMHGFDVVKKYYESQKYAIQLAIDTINKEKIDCSLDGVSSYLFASLESQKSVLLKNLDLFKKMGVKPLEIHDFLGKYMAILVDDTYVLHPFDYVNGLKKIVSKKVSIYENTKIISIEKKDDFYLCNSEKYKIKCKNVVVACHYPFFALPFLLPLKSHIEKSYLMCSKNKEIGYFSAISLDKPLISLRYFNDNFNYLIQVSNSYCLGNGNDEKKVFDDSLNKFLGNSDANILYWSNRDIITNDYLPYIGSVAKGFYIGTGYNTWGLTNGILAGKIISDLICNVDNEYVSLFAVNRGLKITNLFKDILLNVKSFSMAYLLRNRSWYKDVIFCKYNGDDVGIYTDLSGEKHIVYNRCPHLKCKLLFNEVLKTWDCPCHGSRFDIDGKVIFGPANVDITYKK